MKKYIILLCLALGAITNSCTTIDIYASKNLIDYGIDKKYGYYTSWIIVQNNEEPEKYATALNYPASQHNIMPQMIVSHISLDDFTITEEKIDSTTLGHITHYIKKVCYNFNFSEFVVPVIYSEEYAVWYDWDNGYEYQMPSVKITDVETEIDIERLQYETVDGRVYDTYLLTLSVSDHTYIKSTTKVKLLVATNIFIDDTYNEQIHVIVI